MRHLKDKHAGETCVIIGNGQSLNKVDLPRLAKKYPTFGSNRIYTLPFIPMYYAICDIDMLHDCAPDIVKPEFNPEVMFVPRGFPIPGAIGLNYVVSSAFSFQPDYEVVIGGTVTYVLLQLAFWMGFTKVLLVGVDHHYPKASQGGKPGSKFLAEGEDLDHFKPAKGEYFQPGRIYNRPELESTEVMYKIAKSVYARDGRKIINLTSNSRLLVYDRENVKKYY